MPRTAATGQPPQTVEFTDSLRPAVEAGRYTVTVTQEVDGLDTHVNGTDYLQPVSHDFEIRAPQFHLDAGDVHALYPPPGLNGAFHTVLPHITLNRALLPWERALDPSAGTEGPPWLALLLLAPADKVVPQNWTVGQALTEDPAVQLPQLDTGDIPGEVLASSCTTIDVPAALAEALLPTRDELGLLAHTRTGGTDATAGGSTLQAADDAYAVVVANRFPSSQGGTYTVHLVSLEGHQTAPVPSPVKPLRLFSLTSWSFTSHPDLKGGFGHLAEALAHPEPDKDGRIGLLRRPLPTADLTLATQRIRDGYLPLAHHTAPGPRTFAWYRGPLTPVRAVGTPERGPHTDHPSQALIYTEHGGVFDVSYADAFSLGRSLGLADPHFATSLVTFRRTVLERCAAMHQRNDHPVLRTGGTTDALTRLDNLLEDGLQRSLSALFGGPGPRRVPRSATPPRHYAPAPSPLDVLVQESGDPQTLLGQHAVQLLSWLRSLNELRPVPFTHLVPDHAMLPDESLRFFHVDPVWLRFLQEGALSIGHSSTTTTDADTVLERLVSTADHPAPVAGILIRSSLVQGWPALTVTATDHTGRQLTSLRHTQLDEAVLLCLFDGVPHTLELAEPHQGLHFGIEDTGGLALRSLDPDSAGTQLPDRPFESVKENFLRQDSHGMEVLRVNDLAHALAGALGQPGPLLPGQFALQMIKSPEKLAFRHPDHRRT
ncbi:hypothetical protein [Streptomyces olivoreticuli]|uniref:hypothetical protein n=1 Tax=Streptomyces olivoreticuli TaxID=68246 RepID=UPI0013C2A821|nr:hypothetical protein [Streptomyces olivoreticuli]